VGVRVSAMPWTMFMRGVVVFSRALLHHSWFIRALLIALMCDSSTRVHIGKKGSGYHAL